jgi:hypothetical protein
MMEPRSVPSSTMAKATQVGHLGDISQRSGAERIQHVERRDIDDDAPGPIATDPIDQVVLESEKLAVIQCRMDRSNEMRPLPEN